MNYANPFPNGLGDKGIIVPRRLLVLSLEPDYGIDLLQYDNDAYTAHKA